MSIQFSFILSAIAFLPVFGVAMFFGIALLPAWILGITSEFTAMACAVIFHIGQGWE